MSTNKFSLPSHSWQQRWKQGWRYLQEDVLKLNFYRLHMLYFIILTLISSIVVYLEGLADNPTQIDGGHLRFIDALFLSCSAMTTTGLNTINLGALTAFHQAVLCVLMLTGNVVFVSASVVLVRRHYFRRKLAHVVQHSESGRRILEQIDYQQVRQSESSDRSLPSLHDPDQQSTGSNKQGPLRKRLRPETTRSRHGHASHQGVGHHQTGYGWFPAPWEMKSVQSFLRYPFKNLSNLGKKDRSYLPFDVELDQKGRIWSLNEHEREELGGVEYRALDALLWILIAYYFVWLAMGITILVPYAYRSDIASLLRSAQPGNLKPGWFGFFTTVTAFANGGLTLLNSNFVAFRSNHVMLTVCGFLTLAGNTQFPVFLRLLIWMLSIVVSRRSRFRQTLNFLLHHPRRCFIYLFPSKETWYLFAVQLAIDITLWVLFAILNLGLSAVADDSWDMRILDGIFQATGVRCSGAYIVQMSSVAPALLIAYLVAMYVSSFPIVMTVRQTNTYEERSIGLDEGQSGGGLLSYVRRQLSYDLWFQLLAWFLISVIERDKLVHQHRGFDPFTLLFEVTSAYGTVGLSTGVPYDDYSLSGAFRTGSKLIMVAVMIRGRHRGLPFAIDRSILLPGEELMHKMDEQYNDYGKVDKREESEIRRCEEQSGDPDQGSEQDPEEDADATSTARGSGSERASSRD